MSAYQHHHEHNPRKHDHAIGSHHGDSAEHGGHSHQKDDLWDGHAYLNKPGVLESAEVSAHNIIEGLHSWGLTPGMLKTANVLEVGCGPGAVTPHFEKNFATVHAIETSPSMLEAFAAQSVGKSDTVTWGIHKLNANSSKDFKEGKTQLSPTDTDKTREAPPPRHEFDIAICNLVVHHVDDLDSFFDGIKSLLVPGGKIVVTEFTYDRNGKDPREQIREHESEKQEHKLSGKTVNAPGHHLDPFYIKDLSALLEKHGFVDAKGREGKPVTFYGKEYPMPTITVVASKTK